MSGGGMTHQGFGNTKHQHFKKEFRNATQHGKPGPRHESQHNGQREVVTNAAAAAKLEQPEVQRTLPVTEAKASIVRMVSRYPACIVVGETGSGKTTQIPQFVWDEVVKKGACGEHQGIVGCTQPRRVAAVSIAKFVAQQRRVKLGGEVGYAVRFDDVTSADTRIKFMTDGILLRELQTDPMLTKYSCLILDEAHERTLHGDVLFGLLKDLTRKRPNDLKIVVMSATLNATQFSQFWRDAPIGVVHGRSYPVTIFHTAEPQADYVEAAISTILQIHIQEKPGDVLCFLTGQDEIEDAKRVLEQRLKELPTDVPDFMVLPLYSALPYEQQLLVFEPAPNGVRKVILATNIAETSITVEGIKYVVDSGVVKSKSFNTKTGMESLAETDVSKAQATQRTGRAGRMSEGKCFRLFTEDAFDALAENTAPEITRCSLNSVVLQMKAIGINDIHNFEFMDKPPVAAIERAEQMLFVLGALDKQLRITPLGKAMTEFPIEPIAAKSLLASKALGCERDMLAILSMISTENIFLTSRDAKELADRCRGAMAKTSGDHLTYLNLFQHVQRQPQSQRKEYCESNGLSHRQWLKMEDTVKQLFAILQTVDVEVGWFGADMMASHHASRKRNRVVNDDERMEGTEDDIGTAARVAASGYRHDAQHAGGGGAFSSLAHDPLRRALCEGYFLNAAYFDAKLGQYRTLVGQQVVHLHPTSVLFFHVKRKPPMVIFNNVVETTQKFMKDVTAVHEEWLTNACPLLFKRVS